MRRPTSAVWLVDGHRRDEAEHEQARDGPGPARQLAALRAARLRRADEREQEQAEDEDLLPRVEPARAELLDDRRRHFLAKWAGLDL